MSNARWTALLFSIALLARVVTGLGSSIFGTDGCHYLLMADWMREGRFHDALLIAYHPLYPLLIAVGSVFAGSSEAAGEAVSILLGAAATIPLFSLAKSIFGRPTAVFAGLLYAFYPRMVEVQADVMTEGTFMFFLFASMWLTFRVMEEPRLDRAAVLGASAAAAFLTRAEGLLAIALAVGWPVLEAIRRRDDLARRLGGLLLTALVLGLAVSPYLGWVKSVRGRWGLSVRPSAISAEKAVGLTDVARKDDPAEKAARYRTYVNSLLRLTLYGVLVPFILVGLLGLRDVGWRNSLFYLSFPLGYMGGILFAIGTHDFMTERYLMPGMALLGALCAHGIVTVIRAAARRWPERPWAPVACGVLALVLLVAPGVRVFKIYRKELLSCRGAADWIRARHGGPLAVSGIEQVSYYCGSRSYYLPSTREGLTEFLKQTPLDYLVYSDKQLRDDPAYVAMLRSWERLEPPLVYEGPPGTWKIYFQRVR